MDFFRRFMTVAFGVQYVLVHSKLCGDRYKVYRVKLIGREPVIHSGHNTLLLKDDGEAEGKLDYGQFISWRPVVYDGNCYWPVPVDVFNS